MSAMIDDTWRPDNTSLVFNKEGKKVEVEEEQLQMPSVTKLLNRRKLGLVRDLTKSIEIPHPLQADIANGGKRLKRGTQAGLHKEPTLGITQTQSSNQSAQPTAKPGIIPPPFVPKENRNPLKEVTAQPLSQALSQAQASAQQRSLSNPQAEPIIPKPFPPRATPVSAPVTRRPQVQVVKPSTRQTHKSNLIQWSKAALTKAKDPFHRGVLHLIENGANQALLLCPQAKSKVLFEANSCFEAGSKWAIWNGLTFDPAWMGEQAMKFLKQGFIELSPVREANSFLASTFGVEKNEWILLIRCGSPQACTGILVLISNQSVKDKVKAAFTPQTQKAA